VRRLRHGWRAAQRRPDALTRGLLRLALSCLLAALVCVGPLPTGRAQAPHQESAPHLYQVFLPWARREYRVYVPHVSNAQVSPVEAAALNASAMGVPSLPAPEASTAAAERPASGFVTRQGEQLWLDGHPYTFVGVNVSYLAGPFFPESEEEQIVSFLASNGVQVIRVWVEPWIDLARVERTLDLGSKYGVRFILTLQNFFNHETGNWFREQYVNRDLPHIRNIVPLFADRPEVLAWELMNEPTCPAKDARQDCWESLCHWAEVTSQAIKELDPNHLVSVGTLRGGFDAQAMDAFRRMHALDTVDLVSIHCEANKLPQQEFAQELNIAHELGKPVFFGEVSLAGRPGDGQPVPSDALAQRAQVIARSIQSSREAGVVGYLLWQYAHGPTDLTNRLDYFNADPVWEVLRAQQEANSGPE